MRFAAVISHPIQHYSPIFTELAKREGIAVRVFYLTDHGVHDTYDRGFGKSFGWDVPLTEGHDHEFLSRGISSTGSGLWATDAPKLPSRLAAFRPDLVWLHGYASRANWRALLWTRKHACSLFFGDSELLHHRPGWRRAVKQLLVRWFFGQCDAFFTIGDNNAAYYRYYGVPESKLVRGACPVDMSRFTLSEGLRARHRAEVRARYGIPDGALVVVFSGKFQAYKRPLDLIEALALVPNSTRYSVHLLYTGDGPLKDEMLSKARRVGLERQVHVTGFVNQKDMPRHLAAGDILAVTSDRDAHPLTVTEALPFGMPIIASDRVGCVGPTDTARQGHNALVFKCGNLNEIASAILKLHGDEDLRNAMGAASIKIAPTQDVSHAADAIEAAWARLQTGWMQLK